MKNFSISAFTIIPGFTTVQAIYGDELPNRMSMKLSGLYSILSMLAAIVVATVYGILYAVDVSLTQNIYNGLKSKKLHILLYKIAQYLREVSLLASVPTPKFMPMTKGESLDGSLSVS